MDGTNVSETRKLVVHRKPKKCLWPLFEYRSDQSARNHRSPPADDGFTVGLSREAGYWKMGDGQVSDVYVAFRLNIMVAAFINLGVDLS